MRKPGGGTADAVGTAALAHRHDVDGLRAVAVLAILAFHLDLAGFSGGFIGVDIFFVISGYVILRSILPDLERGRFSLADFLVRRMRRLLPALVVVLLAALVAGLVMLSPAELEELAGSALATLAFGANFFFHDRTGYFAAAAHTRPLLHMWSLGIEEQFYILVPLALTALTRLRSMAAGKPLLVLAAVSFAYSLVAPTLVSEKHAFYMPMARFWEIAVGGCIAVAERRWGPLRTGADWIAGVGLLAVAASVVLLDGDAGGQQWAAIPVLGTAVVIVASAADRSRTALVLASAPMVVIGRISYSIYLVHWPLIVFWRLYTARPLLPYEQAAIAVLTLGLAAALSALVETPMRANAGRMANRPALAGIFAAGAVVAAVGTSITLDRGAVWRLEGPAAEAYHGLQSALAERARCPAYIEQPGWGVTACRWSTGARGTDFVIWGDSHAGALAPELAEVLVQAGWKSGLSFILPACQPLIGVIVDRPNCPALADAAMDTIAREKPRIVVMAGRWATVASDVGAPGNDKPSRQLLDLQNNRAPIRLADALVRTVQRVRASGAHVVLIGPVPEIEYDVPSTLVRVLHGFGRLPPVRRTDFNLRQKQVLGALAEIGRLDGVTVVHPHTILCNDETCAVADGTRSFYVDGNHLSPFGAARVSALAASRMGAAGKELAQSDAGQQVTAPQIAE